MRIHNNIMYDKYKIRTVNNLINNLQTTHPRAEADDRITILHTYSIK